MSRTEVDIALKFSYLFIDPGRSLLQQPPSLNANKNKNLIFMLNKGYNDKSNNINKSSNSDHIRQKWRH